MSLSLGLGPAGRAARDKAVELADSALASLDRAGKKRPEKAVHDARKRCKEVRAVLRLIRPGLDEDTYRLENEMFRDASRNLSPMRDAHAMLECFDELVAIDADRFPVAVGPVRDELRRRAKWVTASIRRSDRRIAEARELISAGRVTVSRWQLDDDWDIALDGMGKIYRQGRRGLALSAADGDVHVFHDWRKRVKYLWYHVQMLSDHSPDLLEPFAATLKVVSDTIGDGHDLHVLAETVQARPDRYGGDDLVAAVTEVAEARRADMERRGLNLGTRVYAETPAAFGRRMGSYVAASATMPPVVAGGLDEVGTNDDGLDDRTAAELFEVAADRRVRGRWAMRKDELVLGVRAATAGDHGGSR